MWGRKPQVIQHPNAYELYKYHLGARFDAGSPAEAFEPLFQLPVLSFRGRARMAGQFATLQPAQVYFRQQIGINGVGGVQAGGLRSAPLLDSTNADL